MPMRQSICLLHRAGVGVGILGEPLEIAVHGRQGRHVIGSALLEETQDLVVHHRAVLDRVRAGPKRQLDAIGAVSMDGDLAAIGMRRFDERLGFVVEHARREPRAAVHSAGGGEFDDVRAAVDLPAHDAATALDAVAKVLGARQVRHHLVIERRRARPCDPRSSKWILAASMIRGPWTHPRLTASRSASVTPPSSPRLRTVVKPARSVFIPFISASKACSGWSSRTSASSSCSPPRSEIEMDVAVDQAGQHRLVAKVDDRRTRRRGYVTGPHLEDAAIVDDDGGRPATRPCRERRSAGRRGCRSGRRWPRRRWKRARRQRTGD